MKTFARQCEVTGEGMNEGYLVNDNNYIKYEKDLLKMLRIRNYVTAEGDKANLMNDEDFLEWAYNDEIYYWTQWEEDDHQYKEVYGEIYEIDETIEEIELMQIKRINKDNN